jgi:hypothetical protein
MPDLGNLLGGTGPKVAKGLAALAQLNAPVGSGAFSVDGFDLSGGTGLTLLGQAVRITSSARLTASFAAAGDQEHSVFQEGDAWVPLADHRLAILDLQGAFGIAAQASTSVSVTSLSFKLNASGELRYRHLLSVPAAVSRLHALEGLVGGSQLPQLVSFAGLSDDEVHQFSALLSLSLGAEAAMGKDLTFKTDLFKDLAPEMSVHFQCTVNASLNASLYETLNWTAGKGDAFTMTKGWVRLRAMRESQHRLTLGAQFALDVEYKLGSTLEALLNRALELNPVARALDALRDVQKNSALLAAGDWAAVKDQLDQAVAGRIADFLDPILTNSAELKKIVGVSSQVVQAYDNLGETLQSFWDGLLNRGDLALQRAKLRALLTRITSLPDDPQSLLTTDEQDLIPLIEAISGHSLEEIWLGSGASAVLDKVKAEAARALSFLDALESLPDTALARITEFAKRTGIQGTLDWLRAHAASVAQLKATANDRIQKLIEKLLNKAFAQIDAGDLQKIQSWATSLNGILALPGKYEDELKAKLARLDGTVGFKLAMEVDRVSRTSALLDLEFDPGNKAIVKAMAGLKGLTLVTVLQALLKPDGDNSTAREPLPYMLRECTFTSQRLRTSTRSFFCSLFGTTSNTRQRLTESAIDVRQVGNTITRQASYSGVFTRSTTAVIRKSGHASTAQFAAGAGWAASAQGAGVDLAAPYSHLDQRLRLTITRDDDATTVEELAGIGQLLTDLGFDLSLPPVPQAANHATRLAISLELSGPAVQGFLGNGTYGADWDLDFLNAARRWFDDALCPELDASDVPRGTVLAWLMREPSFRTGWTMSQPDFERAFTNHEFPVHLPDGTTVGVRLVFAMAPAPASWSPYNMVRDAIVRRGESQPPMRAAAQASSSAPTDHPGLSRLAERFARAGDAVSPSFWDSPVFALWLVLARVARTAPESLSTATGFASLRFKDDSAGAWSAPQRWVVDPGRLPRRTPGSGVFPIA